MDKEKFLKITRYIGEKISQTGFENKTYAVGGSVRDFVMGNEIKDIDLVVELPNGGICLAQVLPPSFFHNIKTLNEPAKIHFFSSQYIWC